METSKKYILAIAAGTVVFVIIAGLVFSGVFSSVPTTPQGEKSFENEETASTTAPTTTPIAKKLNPPASPPSPKPKTLPPEKVFVLPEGAAAIDEYAFVYTGKVYFKPLVKTPLEVPSADPESFRRFQDFSTYPGSDVVRDCGGAPLYAFYIDKARPYFYQIWRTPGFRSSQVDAMNGADAENFVVTGPTTATDGNIHFDMTYAVATSTCLLILNQTLL